MPIVIKANTCIAGQVTTDGWSGYTIPGHEFLATRDATIVAKLRAAGAIILGHTNMPDFAASDTNRSSSFGRTGNAYDVRFSPGGSSGGTVTAVAANLAMLGSGTDTGNSIRMPAATSALIGVYPTRGLVSISGIAPLDWLLDNTGPIARNVTDAAIALSVMAGPDPLDPRTSDSATAAQPGPYTQYLKPDALKGKRFGVPAFILNGTGIPFGGVPAGIPDAVAAKEAERAAMPLTAETRAAFMKAIDQLRALGATVVIDDTVLPDSFTRTASRVASYPYVRQGTEQYLRDFGPAQVPDAGRIRRSRRRAAIVGDRRRRHQHRAHRRDRGSASPPRHRSRSRGQLLRTAAPHTRGVPRAAGPFAPGWIRLSGDPDAAARRDHASGRETERRARIRPPAGST